LGAGSNCPCHGEGPQSSLVNVGPRESGEGRRVGGPTLNRSFFLGDEGTIVGSITKISQGNVGTKAFGN